MQIYPTTKWHDFMLSTLLDPACSAGFANMWILANAVHVRPRIDVRRLERAFTKLIQRHNPLRIRFEETGSDWHAVIADPSEFELKKISIPELDDEAFVAELKKIAYAPFHILSRQLVETIHVDCGSRGDVLITRIHHAVTDGFGMIVLAEDLIKLLIGMPVLNKAVGHLDYISRWQSPNIKSRSQYDEYWKAKLADFPAAPDIGRKSKGLEPLFRSVGWTNSGGLELHVEETSRNRLVKRAKSLGVSPVSILFTGFADALCDIYDQEQLMIAMCPARTEPGLNTYCGDHTLDPIVRYAIGREASLNEKSQHLQADVLESIANLPSDYARRGSKSDQEIIERGGFPRQFQMRVVRADNRERRSPFRSAFQADLGEPHKMGPYELTSLDLSPPACSLDELEIEVPSQEDLSTFTLCYDKDAYEIQEIEKLAERIGCLAELDVTDGALL